MSEKQLNELIDVAKIYGSIDAMMKESTTNTSLPPNAKIVLDMAILLQLYLQASRKNDNNTAEILKSKLNELANKFNN